MNRYICIHGHFYQPPRENPWLETIELQDSAYPYHDWNERINTESYAPNAFARILDENKKIADIINNFSRISYDVGPTLFNWLKNYAGNVYSRLREGDMKSMERFSGHGSAIAQAYSHLIMPLANSRDKRTQVLWGMRDFEHRYGRKPEGMWLPETAVDLESLDIMAEQGITFTVLSPHQAQKMRKIGEEKWHDVSGGKVDCQRVYQCNLPSGRTIALFFYDGLLSHEIAFGNLLRDGGEFARRLIDAFPHPADDSAKDNELEDEPRLVHVATDGETYGHHNHFADMALAYCLHMMERHPEVDLTVYGEFLEKFPPVWEAVPFENTSWSCAHGVERWRNDCGDNTGGHPGWNQKWRAPLRETMNWLRDELISVFEQEGGKYLKDPWRTRDAYIDVILDRSPENVDKFISEHAAGDLDHRGRTRFLRFLEMQRHAMLMFTSCGWFFDDISGIETTQVMLYALRAMRIVRDITKRDLEPEFMRRLETAPSNIPEYGNGARVYDMFVRPSMVDLHRVGAHYAISSLFQNYGDRVKIDSYTITRRVYACYDTGVERLVIALARVRSDITGEESTVDLAVLHLGAQNFYGGVRNHADMQNFSRMRREIRDAFQQSDIPQTIALISERFENKNYSLWHLFRDEQRRVFTAVLNQTVKELETSFRQIADHNYQMMLTMRKLRIPAPQILSAPVEYIVNADMRAALENQIDNFVQLNMATANFAKYSVEPDRPTLSVFASRWITRLMGEIHEDPNDTLRIVKLDSLFSILAPLNLTLNIWESQNCYLETGKQYYREVREKAENGDLLAQEWIQAFENLKEHLNIGEVEYALAPVNV